MANFFAEVPSLQSFSSMNKTRLLIKTDTVNLFGLEKIQQKRNKNQQELPCSEKRTGSQNSPYVSWVSAGIHRIEEKGDEIVQGTASY